MASKRVKRDIELTPAEASAVSFIREAPEEERPKAYRQYIRIMAQHLDPKSVDKLSRRIAKILKIETKSL